MDTALSWEISANSSEALLRVANLCQQHGLARLNISHRHAGLREIEQALQLHQRLPQTIFIPHLSLRRLPNLTPHSTNELMEWLDLATRLRPPHILIVSGAPRTECDALWALNQLKTTKIPLAVAYNPFSTDPDEELRLRAKLTNPQVQAVYLQIGENPYNIFSATNLIRTMRPEITIHGCLLLPTSLIRHHFHDRHWHGVILSPDYLRHPVYAWEITHIMLATYQRLGIIPLVEGFPFNEHTYRDYQRFIEQPFSPSPPSDTGVHP